MSIGNIQLLARQGCLEIAAQRGLAPEFLRHFDALREDGTSPDVRALRNRETVAIEDTKVERLFAHDQAAAASAKFRAVCSSPLIAPDGLLLGVLATHYAQPHAFLSEEMQAHGRHARHTASLIRWAQAGQMVRATR